jgi:hypothetical protein
MLVVQSVVPGSGDRTAVGTHSSSTRDFPRILRATPSLRRNDVCPSSRSSAARTLVLVPLEVELVEVGAEERCRILR